MCVCECVSECVCVCVCVCERERERGVCVWIKRHYSIAEMKRERENRVENRVGGVEDRERFDQ